MAFGDDCMVGVTELREYVCLFLPPFQHNVVDSVPNNLDTWGFPGLSCITKCTIPVPLISNKPFTPITLDDTCCVHFVNETILIVRHQNWGVTVNTNKEWVCISTKLVITIRLDIIHIGCCHHQPYVLKSLLFTCNLCWYSLGSILVVLATGCFALDTSANFRWFMPICKARHHCHDIPYNEIAVQYHKSNKPFKHPEDQLF